MTASQKVPSRSFAPVTSMSRRKLLAGTGASLGAAGLAALIARIPGAA